MEVSVSNVIINYFLLHTDIDILKYSDLQALIKQLQQQFNIIIVDNDIKGINIVQQLCSDFLQIDAEYNIIQNNILDYLDELQPIYEWFSFREWQKSHQYYALIKKFNPTAKEN